LQKRRCPAKENAGRAGRPYPAKKKVNGECLKIRAIKSNKKLAVYVTANTPLLRTIRAAFAVDISR
jgi:hypothetical protein